MRAIVPGAPPRGTLGPPGPLAGQVRVHRAAAAIRSKASSMVARRLCLAFLGL